MFDSEKADAERAQARMNRQPIIVPAGSDLVMVHGMPEYSVVSGKWCVTVSAKRLYMLSGEIKTLMTAVVSADGVQVNTLGHAVNFDHAALGDWNLALVNAQLEVDGLRRDQLVPEVQTL